MGRFGLIAVLAVVGLASVAFLLFTGSGADRAFDPANGPNASARTTPVIVAPAVTRTAVERLESVGTARANRAVMITSKVTGRLMEILFEDGEEVAEGDVLVRLDASELEAELQNAEAQLKRAQQDYERALPLRGSQAVSQARVDELEALRDAAAASVAARAARLQEFTITAPFDGTVGVNRLSPGTLIRPETDITTLDDLSIIKVDFALPETVIRAVAEGDRIVASSRALDGLKIEGEIQSLETRVDPVSRTIGAVAVFDNSERLLRPGMFLNLEISLDQRPDAIFVAEEALTSVASQQFVFVVRDGTVERRDVTIGLREPGLVEIRSGVAQGELVVVRGLQAIRDGAPVTIEQTIAPGEAPSYSQS